MRRGHGRGRALVAWAIAGATLMAACSSGDDTAPTTTGPGTSVTSTTTSGRPDGTSSPVAAFQGVRLTAGSATSDPAAPTEVVAGTPLDHAAVDAVIARLPAWIAGAVTSSFQWPAQSLVPPQAGAVVDQPFPSSDATPPPEVPAGPLEVLRFQPDGPVDIAPFVSITFNQPMVPVGTVGQLAAEVVPATISPDVPGIWQWIGTTTLRFDAAVPGIDRLPMATDYTVTVPAGTASATGGVLAADATWTFSTPAPQIVSFQPDDDDSLPLDPVFLAVFDQRVDPTAVLAAVRLTADGAPRDVRAATDAETAADAAVQPLVDTLPEGRWIAFRSADPLPVDAAIDVEVGPNVPSAEGPAVSGDAERFDGRTYAPLRVEAVECASGRSCDPSAGITITMNNPIDAERFDPATISVEPPIEGTSIMAYGNTISIGGPMVPEQTYDVTVPAGLTDVFGQQLGTDDVHTVTAGPARPFLRQLPTPMTTIDPATAKPSVSIVSSGHAALHVTAYAATVDDWPTGQSGPLYELLYYGAGEDTTPDLPVLLDTTVDVAGGGSAPAETAIDLSAVLPDGHGHIVLRVAPVDELDRDDPDWWSNRPTVTWVQSTDIGLDAFSDAAGVRAWTTDLSTGEPLQGVTVRMLGRSRTAATDADGLATLGAIDATPVALIATVGDDTAILPDLWQYASNADTALWHVFDDRGAYRPGETVSVKGWVRRLTPGDAQLARFEGEHSVRYTAYDSMGVTLAEGSAALDANGGFDLTVDLPDGANTGTGTLTLSLDDVSSNRSTSHSFRIAEFRRPDFEVSARPESAGPYVRAAPLTLATDAAYYAGGPLADAPVSWQVTTSAASYSPPGWDEFSFGRWTPWWYPVDTYATVDYGPCCGPVGDTDIATYTGTTDASGSQYVEVGVGDLGDDSDALPVSVRAQATVTDVNRQPITATTDVLVHPADRYVGIRSARTFVRKGEPLDVEVIVTDIDGVVAPGASVTVTAGRTRSVFRDGRWTDETVDVQTCEVTSATEPVGCSFDTAAGGRYRIEATVIDADGRHSRSELTRWVSAADVIPARAVQEESLTIVPDTEQHAPGDTAELLVQAPFATGTGLAVVSHGGISETIRFAVADGSAVVEVPIVEADVPGLDVTIEVVGSTPRTAFDGSEVPGASPRPAFATGQVWLPVSIASRVLQVTATPRADRLAPGDTTAVDVTVTGPDGVPVAGSDLAVIVVDEAVLALTGYELGDPLDTFYGSLPTELATRYGRGSIVLVDPSSLVGEGALPATEAASDTTVAAAGGAAQRGMPLAADSDVYGSRDSSASKVGSAAAPIEVRSNFDALAVWAPDVTTGADGTATVEVPLPDNLTRYRVMVVAADGAQRFGTAESTITARLPLTVRPSAPRFLNVGDSFELPVVVQNQSAAAVDADVVVEVDNLDPTAAFGARVTVPADGRVEVRFPLSAALAGTARIRVSAAAGDAADSATVELPVYTPATSEAFATYGVVDDGTVVQPVLVPTDVLPQYGGLDVSTSSTSLQALTDAVIYLTDYPYESSDALASRILAIVALRDALDAFDAPGLPSAADLDRTVADDVEALVAMQNDDGGFPFWRRGNRSEPYNTVQATHALVAARDAGYPVTAFGVDRALSYLVDIEQRIPTEYGQETRDTITAYALNVRALAGQADPGAAAALYRRRGDDLGLDALAWLWPILDDSAARASIARTIGNRAVDTAGAVTFTSEVHDDAAVTLSSERRTDGLVLDALIQVQPDSDLVPKAVAGLLASQRQGRWDNVQENSFVLLALKRYFDVYESAIPDFVARVWLGQQFAGEQGFHGRSTDTNLVSVPTEQLQQLGDADLTIAKEGVGRLYYRVGLRTAPASLTLDPLDRGFVVERTYEAVDDPADVTRDDDGTWHIAAGARVRVRLTMVAESQRTHVALVDPLPAGLEILNPALATTGDTPPDPSDPVFGPGVATARTWWPWYPTWFDHQNQRDDRAEAFASYLPAGTYDYSYVAVATTPGSYVVAPTKAEEIYTPETWGRAATTRVVVA